MNWTPIVLAACVAAAPSAPAQSAPSAGFEQGVTLRAADLLPEALLRGASHRVRDQVVTDGYLAHFRIDSDFGLMEATGVPHARRRIAEIEAIRKLVETSKSDLFAEGLKRSVEQPVAAVKNIVTKPVDSVKQAPRTVGHFFGKLGSSIGREVDKVKKGAEGDSPASATEVGRGIGDAAMNAAGFDKAKLDAARQLGVDPYTDNQRLQEEMDKVAWAFFAGGLPLRIGAAVASAGVTLTATTLVGVPEETYALTRAELALRDETALQAMGVDAKALAAFMIQPAFSTTRRHRVVISLQALPKALGRGEVVKLANECSTAEQADFLTASLALLAERQRSGAADYTGLKVIGRLPAATTAGGALEVPAPVDHVTWTEDVAGFASRDDLRGMDKVLVHTGSLSPRTQAGLAAAGWKTAAFVRP